MHIPIPHCVYVAAFVHYVHSFYSVYVHLQQAMSLLRLTASLRPTSKRLRSVAAPIVLTNFESRQSIHWSARDIVTSGTCSFLGIGALS